MAWSNGVRSGTADFDTIAALIHVLEARGYRPKKHEGVVVLGDDDLVFLPMIAGGVQALEDGNFQTVTTIEIAHPDFEETFFEYQHSLGSTVSEALEKGFDRWAELDLVPLLDALFEEPASCSAMKVSFPRRPDKPARDRRLVLGPVWAMLDRAHVPDAASESHPVGCACCFVTHNFDSLQSIIDSDEPCAIRFYAMRSADGELNADCRVNGRDYAEGKSAILAYAQSWPGRGFEVRKQYVVIHSIDGA